VKWLSNLWQAHGTKILGLGGTLLGAISMIDATTTHLIEEVLGPHRGHQVASVLMVIGGIATAYRGFKNSQK
jgi:hypothetical protein